MASPQTIANQIGEQIFALIKEPRLPEPTDERFVLLEREGKQLCKADQGAGYVFLASVSALAQDFGAMQRRLQIAENQGVKAGVVMNLVTVLSHMGYYAESSRLIAKYAEKCDQLSPAANCAVSAMQFQIADRIFGRMSRLKLELDEADKLGTDASKVAAQMMSLSGLTDVQIAELCDLAGEVLRAHGLPVNETANIIGYEGEDGLPCLCSTFSVPVSYEEASDMNFELAEKYATRSISVSPNRYTLRFVGTHEHNA